MGLARNHRTRPPLLNTSPTRPRISYVGTFDRLALAIAVTTYLTNARFSSSAENAMSDGERHNIELEMRKRLVRQLAEHFNILARGRDVERCLVAASREINKQLLDELEPQVRAKIEKIIPSDLTKVERAQLMSYF